MEERAVMGIAKALDNPLLDRLIQARNAESLRRFRAMAEGRASTPSTHA